MLAYVPNFKIEVESEGFGNDYLDRLDIGFLEAIRSDTNAIRSGWNERRRVIASLVGLALSLIGGRETNDGYFSSDDRGAVRVFDDNTDAACGLTLGESKVRVKGKQATDPEQRYGVSGGHLLNSAADEFKQCVEARITP